MSQLTLPMDQVSAMTLLPPCLCDPGPRGASAMSSVLHRTICRPLLGSINSNLMILNVMSEAPDNPGAPKVISRTS